LTKHQKLALKHRDKEWKGIGDGGRREGGPKANLYKIPNVSSDATEDNSLTNARNVLRCVRDKLSTDSNPPKTLMYNICARAQDRRVDSLASGLEGLLKKISYDTRFTK